ncbi:hypothetical protein [Rhizobium sp. SSA_523]|uniref:hypothetical protein n=1 Tax=Rhizobium sp. SSA_523 TaxID=2952477 RepID=UPI0020904C05|nr:hypothetical protein [Rhizobium sp. SSA_523]MCO5733701.1 hypothetical protein [Rhizobium sp. SSA_523]WKC23009.1 hypothetical protein QTJ18_19540 [Rhizobium sp. SSA_523]
MDEEFWKTVRAQQRASIRSGRTGALNVALLFGTAAIALSLIVTPMLAKRQDTRHMAHVQEEFDMITTGSIRSNDKGTKHYTIRRSVLQDSPGSICVVQGYEGENPC